MRTLLLAIMLSAGAMTAYSAPSVVLSDVTTFSESVPVSVNGVLRSKRDILLPTAIEGELDWVLAEGTQVLSGMTVARIDDVQLVLELAEQQLMSERAKVSFRYLEGEVQRLRALQKANLSSATQLAEMVSRRDLATNDLNVSNARIARLEDNISRTKIVSPVSGVIVERLRQGGEYARRGDGVLRVVDPGALEVKASVPVAQLGRVNLNSLVNIEIGQVQIDAQITSIIQAGNSTSQTFDVLINLPPESANLFVSGQFATVAISLTNQQALYVPRDAVILRSEGNFVFKVGENNVAERIEVDLGEGYGDLVSVVGDLKEGDQVAIRGVERLESGQTVEPLS